MDQLYPEPFGPLYERPAPADCPNCPNCACCTAQLCEAGRCSMLGCLGRTSAQDAEIRDAISRCPCATAPGSAIATMQERLHGVTDPEQRAAIISQVSDEFAGRKA